ncbi:MAG: YtxH domain-containing protein [Bacteroidetes bacterium]|nr:YtxH domain-containing protein [Bacteroidota bacterium]
MNSGKLFLGILAGFAAGAMLGLLFAPEKGSASLEKIAEKEGDFLDELNQKFDHFLEIVNSKNNQIAKDISIVAKRE